ncbi:unnamed protein product [Caretta caretta]
MSPCARIEPCPIIHFPKCYTGACDLGISLEEHRCPPPPNLHSAPTCGRKALTLYNSLLSAQSWQWGWPQSFSRSVRRCNGSHIQQSIIVTKWRPFTLTSAPEEDFFSIHS